jgi:hypothetical protein
MLEGLKHLAKTKVLYRREQVQPPVRALGFWGSNQRAVSREVDTKVQPHSSEARILGILSPCSAHIQT